eukprot:TRINITY_DN61_c0_g1_i3.p1 TRINITY_DN61_c0_g1~~TRINITY_DN61_c0_g1_i3.p1  ORF type:complete len:463 (-),score=106.30 TRINITY_DN61_c0_g1_i3:39-1427(-)
MIFLFLLVGSALSVPLEKNSVDWDYDWDGKGPFDWGKRYPECTKFRQSPIALPTEFADFPFLKRIEYHDFDIECELELVNQGKWIEIRVKDNPKRPRPSISGSVFDPKDRYYLDRVVIRVGSASSHGSEHGMKNKEYPGEIQWMYYNKKYNSFDEAVKIPGETTIISQLVEIGMKDNPRYNYLINSLKKINGSKYAVDLKWDSTPDFLPSFQGGEGGYDKKEKECVNCDYYFYEGSLTYPPCYETVLWHVYMETIELSEYQLSELRHVLSWEDHKPLNNNKRYIVAANFRDILQHRERNPKAYDNIYVPLPPPPPPPHMYPPSRAGQNEDYPPQMPPNYPMPPPNYPPPHPRQDENEQYPVPPQMPPHFYLPPPPYPLPQGGHQHQQQRVQQQTINNNEVNQEWSHDHKRDERFWFKAPGEIPEELTTMEFNNFDSNIFRFELTEEGGEGEEEGGEEEKKKK